MKEGEERNNDFYWWALSCRLLQQLTLFSAALSVQSTCMGTPASSRLSSRRTNLKSKPDSWAMQHNLSTCFCWRHLICSNTAGSDFIKTSTGKEAVNATYPVAIVMVRAIRDYFMSTGHKVQWAWTLTDCRTITTFIMFMKPASRSLWLMDGKSLTWKEVLAWMWSHVLYEQLEYSSRWEAFYQTAGT